MDPDNTTDNQQPTTPMGGSTPVTPSSNEPVEPVSQQPEVTPEPVSETPAPVPTSNDNSGSMETPAPVTPAGETSDEAGGGSVPPAQSTG